MRVAVDVEHFRRTLGSLVGKPLLAAIATRGSQSCLSLDFGRIICVRSNAEEQPRESNEDQDGPPIRISGDAVKSAESEYRRCNGEFTLMVWCNWRIETADTQMVCGSQDSVEEGKPIQTALQQMMGDTIADISLTSFLDLLLVFDSGTRLRLFCDQNGHENNEDCYRLSIAGGEAYGVITGLIETWA